MALGVSEARMDQGHLRCDVNLSLRAEGPRHPRHPHRDEERQLAPLGRAGGPLRDQRHAAVLDAAAARSCRRPGTGTRTPASPRAAGRSPTPRTTATSPSPTWCPSRRAASGSRSCAATLPESPTVRRARLQAEWGFTDLEMRDADQRRRARRWSRRPSRRARPRRRPASGGSASSPAAANERRRRRSPTCRSPRRDVARVQALVDEKVVNDKLARQVFEGVLAGEGTPDEVVAERGLAVVSDDGALGAAVDDAIAANPDVAEKIRDGKVAAAGALIGAVMKEMRGQADAGRVRELILEKLA